MARHVPQFIHNIIMTEYNLPTALKQLITPNQAFHYRIIPYKIENGIVTLKTDKESLSDLNKELSIVLNFECKLIKDSTENLQSFLTFNYRQKTTLTTNLSESNFLRQVLQTAKDFDSSDIHLEPFEEFCRVRFRLDGKLKEQYRIPQKDYPKIINKIKNDAQLDISQKRLPQDGRITINNNQESYDIRVSTLPSLHGEKIVLRILKQNTANVELEKLGFKPNELHQYQEGIKMSNGIILISGPTGSGKTTTLYGTLKLLNTEERNILTIEDPIEYTLDGITQVQLKEEIGLNFPKALRTFLRQDPDIIMIGEIRDKETADMAIRAALTGHLVFSTIHTNSAWATITRLLDMGIPHFMVASTLKLSVAQRLVRTLCDNCKKEQACNPDLFPDRFSQKNKFKTHFIPVGCEHCYFTGYNGRKAIYELIPIHSELELAIKQNQLQIDEYVSENKLNTLKSNAVEMILTGETSIEEVFSLLVN